MTVDPAALGKVFQTLAVATAILAALVGILSAFGFSYVQKVRLGKFEIVGGITKEDIQRLEQETEGQKQPFEIASLASYYNQALARAQVSFWFSLTFASIGFGLITFAFFSHQQADLSGTLVKVLRVRTH